MVQTVRIEAVSRERAGKGAARATRKDGRVPAVIYGAKKEALTSMLIGLLESGAEPQPDLPVPVSWPPVIGARIDSLMKKRSEATGKDLNDPEVRKKSKIANFRFYGAPHGMLLFQDASLTPWSIFDMGLFAQNIMLAAHAYGLGTVPQAFLTDYAPEVKQFLNIPETKRMVLGISIGYPDMESPVNAFRTDRVETSEIVKVMS